MNKSSTHSCCSQASDSWSLVSVIFHAFTAVTAVIGRADAKLIFALLPPPKLKVNEWHMVSLALNSAMPLLPLGVAKSECNPRSQEYGVCVSVSLTSNKYA